MKKLLIGLLALSSLSVFGQSEVESCLSLTRVLIAKELICAKEMDAVSNSTGSSINALKKLDACLAKSDEICLKAARAGDNVLQANYYSRNTLAQEVSCQKQLDEVSNVGGRDSLKKLDECLADVIGSYLSTIH